MDKKQKFILTDLRKEFIIYTWISEFLEKNIISNKMNEWIFTLNFLLKPTKSDLKKDIVRKQNLLYHWKTNGINIQKIRELNNKVDWVNKNIHIINKV